MIIFQDVSHDTEYPGWCCFSGEEIHPQDHILSVYIAEGRGAPMFHGCTVMGTAENLESIHTEEAHTYAQAPRFYVDPEGKSSRLDQ